MLWLNQCHSHTLRLPPQDIMALIAYLSGKIIVMPCDSADWLSWNTPFLTRMSVTDMCVSFHILTLRNCHQQYNINQVYLTRTIYVLSRCVVSICNDRWSPHSELMRLFRKGIMLLHCLTVHRRLDWAAIWQVGQYRSKHRATPQMEEWMLAWWAERCSGLTKSPVFVGMEADILLPYLVQSVTRTCSLIVLVADTL